LLGCAKRNRPTGGPKDESAPIMVSTKPPYKTVNFKSDEIRIYFDEYIKLKDVSTQLVVSPPLKYPAEITPLGTPSKYINIKIADTLKENTTYTFNFGQSIIDNTEGNILTNFKYIFSTGPVIDSLAIKGTIRDAFNDKADEFVTIMLYEANDTYTDSIVYKEKPLYVGNTLDSIAWEITNIKAGKYMLVALNDASKNYIFNPKEDKIGFVRDTITIPTEEEYELTLFKEILPYELKRPSVASQKRLIFGYQGIVDSIKIKALNVGPDFKYTTTFEKDKDTLNYWYSGVEADSLHFIVENKKISDTVAVRLLSKNKDSLTITTNARGVLPLRDSLMVRSNIPLQRIDTTKFKLIRSDSIAVPYTAKISKSLTDVLFDFEKMHNERYKLEILPEGISDFYGHVNDTLQINFNIKQPADYGSLYFKLENVKSYPILVQLTTLKGQVIETIAANQAQEFAFLNLTPSKYKMRVIYDTNANGKWDTGNYLLKIEPETVIYYPKEIEVRANWDPTETFILK
tara:strand:+ start:104954 stop:106501 length:1548 start_codon:yes stop_codon:yes gene_type:complete